MSNAVINNKSKKLHTPFRIFEGLLRIFLAVSKCLRVEEKEQTLMDLGHHFATYIENLEPDLDCLLNEISHLSGCLEVYELIRSENNEIMGTFLEPEKIVITVVIKYLSFGSLEKKMSAISFLSKQVEVWKSRPVDQRKQIAEGIFQQSVLELIFKKDFHEELAKKAKELVEFLIPFEHDGFLLGLLEEAAAANQQDVVSIWCGCLASSELRHNIRVDSGEQLCQQLIGFLAKRDARGVNQESLSLLSSILEILFSNFQIQLEADEKLRMSAEAIEVLWSYQEASGGQVGESNPAQLVEQHRERPDPQLRPRIGGGREPPAGQVRPQSQRQVHPEPPHLARADHLRAEASRAARGPFDRPDRRQPDRGLEAQHAGRRAEAGGRVCLRELLEGPAGPAAQRDIESTR